MAGWNGSGVFYRLYSWVADAAAGIDITASRMDADTDLITTNGFGNTLTRDGQGSATANLPMNSFRHTGAGDAVNPQDYLTLGQVTAESATLSPSFINVAISGTLTIGSLNAGALGEIRIFGIPTLPSGWEFCAGQTRPRTDPLWVFLTANSIAWAWGNGDGTTTYTMPDLRGRVPVGLDNMGGTAANRVTNAVSGIAGTTLGATGGSQLAQEDPISLSGSVSAGSAVSDAGHVHPAQTSGSFQVAVASGGTGTLNAGTNVALQGDTGTAFTGISVATTITNTLSVASGLTGASQNMPPAAMVEFAMYCGA